MNTCIITTVVTLALAVSAVAAATSASEREAYGFDVPLLPVKSIQKLVLHDAARKKDLQVHINYPDAAGPFPVIIFSHGALGTKDNYQALTGFWASHGYVTIQANHSDSFALGNRPGDPAVFRDWQSRPADVSFIIDSLPSLETMEPALKGRLDRDHVGVGGHSFGANTAQLIGGAHAFVVGGKELNFEDKRVKAVLLMSGQGPGEMLTKQSWSAFRTPMLVMSGSKDGPTRTGQPAEWRKQPYELSPPGDKFLVWVEGLDHGYGGITGASFNPKLKPNPDHVALTKTVTLAFWDAYLKQEEAARQYLASDRLQKSCTSTLTLSRK